MVLSELLATNNATKPVQQAVMTLAQTFATSTGACMPIGFPTLRTTLRVTRRQNESFARSLDTLRRPHFRSSGRITAAPHQMIDVVRLMATSYNGQHCNTPFDHPISGLAPSNP